MTESRRFLRLFGFAAGGMMIFLSTTTSDAAAQVLPGILEIGDCTCDPTHDAPTVDDAALGDGAVIKICWPKNDSRSSYHALGYYSGTYYSEREVNCLAKGTNEGMWKPYTFADYSSALAFLEVVNSLFMPISMIERPSEFDLMRRYVSQVRDLMNPFLERAESYYAQYIKNIAAEVAPPAPKIMTPP